METEWLQRTENSEGKWGKFSKLIDIYNTQILQNNQKISARMYSYARTMCWRGPFTWYSTGTSRPLLRSDNVINGGAQGPVPPRAL